MKVFAAMFLLFASLAALNALSPRPQPAADCNNDYGPASATLGKHERAALRTGEELSGSISRSLQTIEEVRERRARRAVDGAGKSR